MLLASMLAPETIGILQTLLFDNDRRLKESVMLERMTRLFNDLNTETFTREMALTKLNDWLKNKYVIRQFAEGDEEPYCELTPGAFDAISFVSGQTQERLAPTSSRLGLLLFSIRKLVDDTDADVSNRLQRLEQEKRAIEKKMEAVRAGSVELPSDLEVRAQVQDILNILEGMDGDFLRVRDRLIQLSNNIQASILSENDSLGNMLEDVFKGYDAIQQSEEGQTFESFYRFLLEELSSREMDSWIEELEKRYFWKDLKRKDAEALAEIVTHLNQRSRDTLFVMKRLASGLRQLVRNRNYYENRRLYQLLREARQLSVKAAEKGAVDVNTEILTADRTYIRLSSPASGKLFDTSVNRTEEELQFNLPPELDEAGLARKLMASEIDFNYLKETIEKSILERSPVTLGQIMEKYPAKQGLASLVGYLHLARPRAQCVEAKKETVRWLNRLNESVQAEIPTFVFSESNLDSEGKLL